jgi:hypothetical protein
MGSAAHPLLFLVGCIGTRALFAYGTYIASPTILPYIGAVAATIAIGFIAIYLFNLRPTGLEVGGARIWWNHLRPVHAILYAITATLAIQRNPNAWIPLAADVVIGLSVFLHHHYA